MMTVIRNCANLFVEFMKFCGLILSVIAGLGLWVVIVLFAVPYIGAWIEAPDNYVAIGSALWALMTLFATMKMYDGRQHAR